MNLLNWIFPPEDRSGEYEIVRHQLAERLEKEERERSMSETLTEILKLLRSIDERLFNMLP